MHVIVLNGSPHRTHGNTHKLLAPFVEGMIENGAQVETVHVRNLQVAPCKGCMSCWRSGGRCVQSDDMDWLRPKISACDVLVLGVPVYVDCMPGQLKTIMDRLVANIKPEIVLVDGHCRHPRQDGVSGPQRFALAGVCGFWELDNFDPLVAWAEAMVRNFDAELAATLLRPHAYVYANLSPDAPEKQAVITALRDAGRQIAKGSAVCDETEAAVAAPLISLDEYLAQSQALQK